MCFPYGKCLDKIESFVEKLSLYYKIHARDVINRDHFLGHKNVERFNKVDVQTHCYTEPTQTFQYTNFYSRHLPGVKKALGQEGGGTSLYGLYGVYGDVTLDRVWF